MNTELNYRTFLNQELEARKRRNPAYSLRSFARDLGMNSSKLSEVLNAKCGLSDESANRIAKEIKLSVDETNLFLQLVRSEHSRNYKTRMQAKKEIETLKESMGYAEIDLERFKIIADWQHFAILELTELSDFQSSSLWIARKLNIEESVAQKSIERLVDFGLLKVNEEGRFVQTSLHLATPSGITSRVIREHHLQILNLAQSAIADLPTTEREVSSTTLAIDFDRMDEAREFLKAFRRQFSQDMQGIEKKNRVYCLSMQFFPLDQNNN